jgi:glucan phosphoethanolaminetransferase (alkaline phosphatase superfamily)
MQNYSDAEPRATSRGSKLPAILKGLAWSLALAATFALAEFAFTYLAGGYRPRWDRRELVVMGLICIAIVMCRNPRLARVGLILIAFLQFSATAYFAYFGAFYSPSHVALLFLDPGEIVESALGSPGQLVPPLALSLATLWLGFQVLRGAARSGAYRSRLFGFLLILLLMTPIVDAYYADNSQKYEPDAESLAIKNGLYSVAFFVGNDLPGRMSGRYKFANYAPYSAQRETDAPARHVILILGESTAYSHWQLYGYDRPTTPQLARLAQGPDFVWRYGVAAGVSTRVAVPMLMNAQREPDNLQHIGSKSAALFRLAKQNGFQTAFLSSQKMDGISSSLSSPDIDLWQDINQLDDMPGELDRKLISAIERTGFDWKKPVFMVLNPRCCHSPYDQRLPPDESRFSTGIPRTSDAYRVASYDDAMLYLDGLLADLMKAVQAQSKLPVVFVMTSDHGQKLGEDGQFGHNFLDLATAKVPFFVYGPQGLPDSARELPCVMPHYEIARFLAHLVGYRIDNPNGEDDRYFVNGVDITGRGGFIDYSRRAVEAELECSNTPSLAAGAP